MKSAASITPPPLPQAPAYAYAILNTKSIEESDSEGTENYNNTKMKLGRLFTAATQHLTPDVVSIIILVKS